MKSLKLPMGYSDAVDKQNDRKHNVKECGRSWVRQVKRKTVKLVFGASPQNTQHKGERAKTGWLGIKIMFRVGRHIYPRTVISVTQHYANPSTRVMLL